MAKPKKQTEDTKIIDLNLKQITELIDNLELKHLKYDLLEKLCFLVIAAMGFLVAIAWQESLKLTFIEIFGSTGSIFERFLYPVGITIASIIISVFFSRYLSKKIKKK